MTKERNAAEKFANSLMEDIFSERLTKTVLTNSFPDFSEGMQARYREQFRIYLGSSMRFLMDKRLAECEDEYHG